MTSSEPYSLVNQSNCLPSSQYRSRRLSSVALEGLQVRETLYAHKWYTRCARLQPGGPGAALVSGAGDILTLTTRLPQSPVLHQQSTTVVGGGVRGCSNLHICSHNTCRTCPGTASDEGHAGPRAVGRQG